jgi:Fic family protein
LEFIHPFSDGNGRMGRLWQQRILMAHSPIFEFLVVESLVHRDQLKYYEALEASDLAADSTPFIEFSLGAINSELKSFQAQFRPRRLTAEERIERALEHFGERSFSRKHYQALHAGLSAASASRDLARAVSQGRLAIHGTKATAVYRAR